MKASVAEVLERAGEFFMKRSPIHRAAESIARALREVDVPFAIAGALAANVHGHVRTTQDVDILITREGLAAFKARWLGRGWVEVFPGSKGVRDTDTGVKIDFLISGDYPGDGKPKPVSFPHPVTASETSADGLPVVSLVVLVSLKLASGMTAAHRLQDLADVVSLIRVNRLPLEYQDELDPWLRAKFADLWHATEESRDEY